VLLNDHSWPTPVASVSISDATVTEGNTGEAVYWCNNWSVF
jgi:hypothetical protein